jgi:hypothetical protein
LSGTLTLNSSTIRTLASAQPTRGLVAVTITATPNGHPAGAAPHQRPPDAAIAVDNPAMTELSMPMDLRPHWRLLAQSPAILPGAFPRRMH